MPFPLLADAADGLSAFEQWERDVVHAFTCTWHGPFLETVSRAVENKLLPVVLLVLALAWVFRTDRGLALRGLFAAGVGVGVGLLVAHGMWATIGRDRPQRGFATVLKTEAELATCAAHPEALALRSGGSTNPGFPSQHAVTAGAFVTALWLVRRWFGAVAALYGLAVCAQRLHSGKHWPSDLLAGVAVGWALAWAAWRLYPPIARRLGLPVPLPAPPAPPAPPAESQPGTGRMPG